MRFFIILFFTTCCFAEDKYEVPKSTYVKIEPKSWQIRWHLARTLLYAGRVQESISEYQKLIKMKPRIYEAKIELANIFLSQNDLNETLELLKKIPLRKIDALSRILLADIYFQLKKYKEAEKLYKKYLIREPRDFLTRSKLASIYISMSEYEKALKEYKQILFLDPKNIEAKRNYLLVQTLKNGALR